MITVTPEQDGPDYTGWVNVQKRPADSYRAQGIWLDLVEAREVFGQLGDALKLIDANQDAKAPQA